MNTEYIQKLVVERLMTIPPEISFSIGNYGDFTRNQLIAEVEKNSAVGKATIEMELNFLRQMPKLSQMIK
jgi:hypothetical protein